MYIASLSYGKDSIYMLEIIHQNKLPLDRIIHAEIMATDTINADLPPMVEFKARVKRIIEDRYGIEVEHLKSNWVYEKRFYKKRLSAATKKENYGKIYGWPLFSHPWCSWDLKRSTLEKVNKTDVIEYVGYAIDETQQMRQRKIQEYLSNKEESKKIYPLVDYGITEQEALDWCKENNLLSPIYKSSTRGGCWFCHNQTIGELRMLRKNYPDYWELMLRWDKDSPTTWDVKRTLHDYDKRFQMEDKGLIPLDRAFRWKMIERGD